MMIKELCITLYNAHVLTHMAGAEGEHLQRPKITQGMLEEAWLSWKTQWQMYKDGTGLKTDDYTRQLLYCCNTKVMEIIVRSDQDISNKSEDEFMKTVKSIALVPVALGV